MTEKIIHELKDFVRLSDYQNNKTNDLPSIKKTKRELNEILITLEKRDRIQALNEIISFIDESNFKFNLREIRIYYQNKLDMLLDDQFNEEPGTISDRKRDQIIKLATDGRKVQKKHKKHAEEFMRSYSVVKNDNSKLSIEGFIEEIGMTKLSNNTYREWIEKYDNAEKMLSNDH